MSNEEAAMRGADVVDLLDHIAWRETIKPHINETRQNYYKCLVQSNLGVPIGTPSGAPLSPQQIAGMIYGLDFIEQYIAGILARGEKSLQKLQLQQH